MNLYIRRVFFLMLRSRLLIGCSNHTPQCHLGKTILSSRSWFHTHTSRPYTEIHQVRDPRTAQSADRPFIHRAGPTISDFFLMDNFWSMDPCIKQQFNIFCNYMWGWNTKNTFWFSSFDNITIWSDSKGENGHEVRHTKTTWRFSSIIQGHSQR